MSEERLLGSREEIASSLRERAFQLWGRDRTEALRSVIEETAGHIWRVSRYPPPPDEEPGFYF